MQTHCGKIIGAAEGNKEMNDRHKGFGAYDVPFLGKREEKEAKEVPCQFLIFPFYWKCNY